MGRDDCIFINWGAVETKMTVCFTVGPPFDFLSGKIPLRDIGHFRRQRGRRGREARGLLEAFLSMECRGALIRGVRSQAGGGCRISRLRTNAESLKLSPKSPLRNKKRRHFAIPASRKCPGQDLNLQGRLIPLGPEPSASANFATWAKHETLR